MMLETKRETNRNFISWEPVTAGATRFFTQGGPVNWRHEILDTPEWPPVRPEESVPAWQDIEDVIEKMTPSDEELVKLAEGNRPPEEWFKADEECPF